jgi:hypothetical protein
MLLPAVVAAATAMSASDAAASNTDPRWDGRGYTSHAVRYQRVREVPSRSRKRIGRSGIRRAGLRQRRALSRRRAREAAGYSRRVRRPAARTRVQARYRRASPALLEGRSLVAGHPRFPEAGRVASSRRQAGALAAPRCKTTHPNVFAFVLGSLLQGFQHSEPAMVEGAWPHCRGASHPQTTWRRASHGPVGQRGASAPWDWSDPADWSIHWRASESCLASPLRAILDMIADEFGPLTVNSTCRSPNHNRRVGGAPRSYHLTGNAVDFRVRDRYGEVLSFLKKMRTVGGVSHYGAGVFHIDTGPRRTWRPGSWSRSWGRGRARARMARRGSVIR